MLLRKKFTLLISSTGLITGILIYVVSVWILENYLSQNNIAQKEETVQSIKQDISVFERILTVVEKEWNEELKSSLPKLANEVDTLRSADRSVDGTTLDALRYKYDLSDLHLIGQDLVVFNSTFKKEIGLDMKAYGQEYANRLQELLDDGGFFTHGASLSTNDGSLKKYAYYSIPNSNIIINGDIDLRKRLQKRSDNDIGDYLFGEYSKQIENKYRVITRIDLYVLSNVDQWSLFNPGQRLEEKNARALFEGNYVQPENARFTFEHIDIESYRDSGLQIFLRIDFDTSLVDQTKSNLRIFLLCVTLMTLVLTSFILRVLVRRTVVDRFTSLLSQVRTNQESNHHAIKINGKDELSMLSEEINEMMARIKHEKSINKQLSDISQKDALTGIANRRSFNEKIALEWEKAQLTNEPFSLIMLDVDYFKEYNDQYGHPAGDECLRKIAACLKATLSRPSDLAARFGGEEFVCVLPSTDSFGAAKIVQAIHQNVLDLAIEHANSKVKNIVSLSSGCLTIKGASHHSIDDLLKEVDNLLYASKHNGRDRISYGEL